MMQEFTSSILPPIGSIVARVVSISYICLELATPLVGKLDAS